MGESCNFGKRGQGQQATKATNSYNLTGTVFLVTMAARSHLARPPYVDPNTNIIYDTDNPEYQGYLTKQSMWLKVRF
jgi:hypothetical protein